MWRLSHSRHYTNFDPIDQVDPSSFLPFNNVIKFYFKLLSNSQFMVELQDYNQLKKPPPAILIQINLKQLVALVQLPQLKRP